MTEEKTTKTPEGAAKGAKGLLRSKRVLVSVAVGAVALLAVATFLLYPSLRGSATPAAAAPAAAKTVLKVGASPTPHAKILEQVKGDLAKEGIDLQIIEYTDYVLPNTAVQSGENDANYFQHVPYLDEFNTKNNTTIVSIAAIHFEPLGIYPGKTTSLAALKDGAKIAVPNDATNEARALLLLQDQGLLKLKAGVGLEATPKDVVENPKNIEFVEVEAAAAAATLKDVDLAVINGNYALSANLPINSALASEAPSSVAATTYGNIVAVKAGNENNPAILALIKALKSDKVKKYIETTFGGSVVAIF